MADYFQIDPISGIISIKKLIDLESEEISKLGGLLEFKIEASEIGDEASTQQTYVTVAVSDINDNEPKFNKEAFELSISPKSAVGTSLTLLKSGIDSIHVFDFDKGINGSFSLRLIRAKGYKDAAMLYDNNTDFEVVPKIALNDANLIIKVKESNNLMGKIGTLEHYQVVKL